MFFTPEDVVSCADGFSMIGTLLGNAPLFNPDAKVYVIISILSVISISLTESGRCVATVDFEGSPA